MKTSEKVTLLGCVILCIGGVLEWREHRNQEIPPEKVWETASKEVISDPVKTDTDEIPFATD